MDLNLEERLTPEEITELRKRAFSFADQMFMEGISIGRSLARANYYSDTETFVKDKISAMTAYFVRDDIWRIQPPVGYNPDPNVPLPEPTQKMRNHVIASMDMAEDPLGAVNNIDPNEDDRFPKVKPEWVKKYEETGVYPAPEYQNDD